MSKSKKKIAFVISSLSSGGAERVISNLSNELINRFQIVIITFSNTEPFYNLDERIKVIPCIKTINQPKSIFHSLKLNYKLTKKIYQIYKAEKVDIAFGFITAANILATIAGKLYGIPIIISERNNPLIIDVPKFWKVLRTFVYPWADKLVLQTNGVKNIYKNKIKPNKLILLPNPISLELTSKRDDSVIKENLILNVGRLDENKCQEDLIMAFNNVKPKNWKLLIIGDGYKKQELFNLIEDLKLTENIKIISKIKRVEEYYNKASIFVFTSKSEGFPNALLEAMHFGLPSISTDCDFGPSELITNGENGFLTPISQVQTMSDRLSELISSQELRNKFSVNSKLKTEAYETKNAVIKWEELINSLLLP